MIVRTGSGGFPKTPMIFLFPFICALFAGCTALPPRGQQMWRSFVNHDYPDEPIGTPAFESALDRYTESRARPGNSVRLLQNGDEAYPVMLELIESARTRISLETYIVEKDSTTDAFFTALGNAARRGVEIRVLADAAGFRRGTIADLGELECHGIQARVFNSYFFSWTVIRGNNRDHRKILVVDGEHAVMGGINLSDLQLGDGRTGWRDTSLLVSGPAAADAERVFAQTWEEGGRGFVGKSLPLSFLTPIKSTLETPVSEYRRCNGRGPFVPPPYTPPGDGTAPPPSGDYDAVNASVRVVSSAPDTRNSPTYDLAILGIEGAREKIDIACAYFVPPLNLRRALVSAAERGVRVRLLLPKVTDVLWVREIGMRFYGELLGAGIEIYEWPHPILHSKTMAIDGKWLVVGSANMDSRSYFLNYEANFAVADPVLAARAHADFEADIAEGHPLARDEWLNRGARQELRETLLIPLGGQF